MLKRILLLLTLAFAAAACSSGSGSTPGASLEAPGGGVQQTVGPISS
jgi:hypothetical protein